MALIKTRITYRGAIAALFEGKRQWNAQVEKPSWRDVGLYHKRRHLAKHFTEAGAREYGYAPRRGDLMARGSKNWRRSYQGRKWRRLGHTRPLEWSGELKWRARNPEIRPTARGVRLVMQGTQKANLRHPKSKVRMADELRAVSPAEVRVLVREKTRSMGAHIQSVRATRTRTL